VILRSSVWLIAMVGARSRLPAHACRLAGAQGDGELLGTTI
jgi:hypothetical protein